MLLGAVGMASVGKAVFIDHLALNCACVGGNSKTPLGVVSFAENFIMASMGAVMLAGRYGNLRPERITTRPLLVQVCLIAAGHP